MLGLIVNATLLSIIQKENVEDCSLLLFFVIMPAAHHDSMAGVGAWVSTSPKPAIARMQRYFPREPRAEVIMQVMCGSGARLLRTSKI